MAFLEKNKRFILYFLVLVYFSGAIGFVFHPDFFLPFTPLTLILTCFTFIIFNVNVHKNFYISFLIIAIVGYISEVIGVKTGIIFGNYSYGKTLGFKLMEVPLVISINWALIIASSVLVCSHFSTNRLMNAISSAILATLIDFLIEKVAPLLDFWKFENGAPSFHNYIGWVLISFIAGYFFNGILLKGNKKIAFIILLMQVLFFGFIYIYIYIYKI